MAKGKKNRYCWECNRKLGFEEFYSTNHTITKERALELWNCRHLEYYCCSCFTKKIQEHKCNFGIIKKILFAGMENSGKTTILNTFRDMQVPDCLNLPPTRGYLILDLIINETNFIVWDLAGTLNYRRRWLAYHKKYFSKVDEFFFVIDVQDPSNFNNSILYMANTLDILKRNYPEVEKINILFHKSDPEFIESEEHTKNVNEVRSRLEKLDFPNDYEIYNTSILNFNKNHKPELFNQGAFNSFGEVTSQLLCSNC